MRKGTPLIQPDHRQKTQSPPPESFGQRAFLRLLSVFIRHRRCRGQRSIAQRIEHAANVQHLCQDTLVFIIKPIGQPGCFQPLLVILTIGVHEHFLPCGIEKRSFSRMRHVHHFAPIIKLVTIYPGRLAAKVGTDHAEVIGIPPSKGTLSPHRKRQDPSHFEHGSSHTGLSHPHPPSSFSLCFRLPR